ncbi:MAG: NAD(+) kinase [Thiotrichales bacterium]
MTAFSRIGVITKPQDPRVTATLAHLLTYLRERGLTILPDESFQALARTPPLTDQVYSRAEIARESDLVVVVGGDGTLLHAARSLADHGVPVVGVNVGRLGFLVDVSPEHLHTQLDAIFAGDYQEERRTLLCGTVMRGAATLAEHTALNDIVLHVRDVVRMIDFETRIDGRFVHSQRADGYVVSTPTGSTAYALSCGGPLLHPGLDAFALVPIASHTLSNRPIVVTGDSEIEIILLAHSQSSAQIAFDGQSNIDIEPEDRVVIRKAPAPLRLIHPIDYDYYAILRRKLRWSEQP